MRAIRLLPLVAAAFVAACTSTTEPRPLPVDARIVVFGSEAERLAWPTTTEITGGGAVTVRGWASLGCGDLKATATRRGGRIDVDVTAVNSDRLCVAVYPLLAPFETTVAVEAGTWRVYARVVGRDESTGVVTVMPGAQLL